jgi:hypothetical protein
MTAADLGLTRTHGFFIIMGGFHCFTGSDKAKESYKPEHPLRRRDVISLLRAKTIGLPTEGEIQDRSKSDWFAKTLVLFQTLWFVMQCIARRIEHLPTTELEIVTLAYTTIYFGIFLAWWDKPRNVEWPVRVFQQPIGPEGKDSVPWWIRVLGIIVGAQDDWVNLHEERKVPIFYSGDPKDDRLLVADGMTLTAGVVFGAIHCIAWSFDFATPIQALLWRLSAVAITAVPVVFMIPIGLLVLSEKRSMPITSVLVIGWFIPLLGLLYITARLITVILAFISLFSLPPGAFETVHWTTLIPHL